MLFLPILGTDDNDPIAKQVFTSTVLLTLRRHTDKVYADFIGELKQEYFEKYKTFLESVSYIFPCSTTPFYSTLNRSMWP